MSQKQQKIGWKTAAAIVIANMIGTGVFTSLGFQIADIQNTWSIILLWLIGGMLGLIGAFTYLAAAVVLLMDHEFILDPLVVSVCAYPYIP